MIFHSPTRIRFGAGCRREAPACVAALGRRTLLVTGVASAATAVSELEPLLAAAGVVVAARASARGEPDTVAAGAAAETARAAGCDVVLAVGGGSAIDLAKAAAGLAPNPGEVRIHCEGQADPPRRLDRDPLPLVCVPTTAGTGSEVTRNSVLTVPEQRAKRSLRDDRLAPRAAFIDPQLSSAAPLKVRAAAAFDALAHCAEAFCSRNATALTDPLAREGLERARRGLEALCADGGGADDLALAALLGGLCLANAGLGAAHGLVAPLGGRFPALPHGAALACLLPAVLRVNEGVARREGDAKAQERLDELAALILDQGAAPHHAADRLDRLRRELGLSGLAAYGVTADALPALVRAPSGSLRTNPIPLSEQDLIGILSAAL